MALAAGCGGGGDKSRIGAYPPSAAPGADGNQQVSGKVIADSGFRTGSDGFSFANYGNPKGVTNMTPADMVRLFGARCARAATRTRAR